ncbi:FGGY-family carbohydrate kinase [Desulfobacula sp.]
MVDKTILAIDCGTQSLRGMIFSQKGKLLEKVQIEYEPYFSKHPGWAEQDPELYWNSLVKACQKLKSLNNALFTRIAGVGVMSQRASMINVDENGDPLRPAIIWLDQRKAQPFFASKGLLNLGLKMVNLEKLILGIQADGKCNWIRQNQPDVWGKTHKYLQVSGFLNYRLTGNFIDSIASQIGHVPFSYKRQAWAKKYELASRIFPIETEKLPQIAIPGEIMGTITLQAARATGLEKGLPVIACGSDKGCETLGAGVIKKNMASLSFGTMATVQTTSDKYFEAIRFMPAYPAPVPGFFNSEVEIFRGFWMITWFKKEFAQKEVEQAKKAGIPAEEVLNKFLEQTEPGSMGLIVQPYWGPGLGRPKAKGAMIGFGDVHKKSHIYRAVIEGLGFALCEGMETIEKKTKVKIEKAAVSGGASQSDEICKITADIFNIPMIKGRTHETSGLGAAIIIARGIGMYSGFDEAVDNMIKIKRIFEPDQNNVMIYKELYSKVYSKMYKALEPLYSRIQQITGYPKE